MFQAIANFFISQFNNLTMQFALVNIFEIGIIVLVLFFAYNKFIKHTQSEKLVRGLIFLVIFWLFGEFLVKINLQILGVFFKSVASVIVLSLVVIFQPEMRRFLGYLGQQGFINKLFSKERKCYTESKRLTMEKTHFAINRTDFIYVSGK